MNDMNNHDSYSDLFGAPIYTYTRAQALEDGVLVDVSELAREAGFRYPVAMTRAAWVDCVDWSDQDNEKVCQDAVARQWNVLFLAAHAARRSSGDRLTFLIHRIPKDRCSTHPEQVSLQMLIGPGDRGEPVMTIMLHGED
ncbi:MAG: hypothetical protein K0M66_11055 [Thiobacillus sp.]|nr:hypothetical protein [Thiobacillus sp.]